MTVLQVLVDEDRLARLEAIELAAMEWKKAGDAFHLFMSKPNFGHVLSKKDRDSLQERFHGAVDRLYKLLP